MPGWLMWLLVGLLAWALLAVPLGLFVARLLRLSASSPAGADAQAASRAGGPTLVLLDLELRWSGMGGGTVTPASPVYSEDAALAIRSVKG